MSNSLEGTIRADSSGQPPPVSSQSETIVCRPANRHESCLRASLTLQITIGQQFTLFGRLRSPPPKSIARSRFMQVGTPDATTDSSFKSMKVHEIPGCIL